MESSESEDNEDSYNEDEEVNSNFIINSTNSDDEESSGDSIDDHEIQTKNVRCEVEAVSVGSD